MKGVANLGLLPPSHLLLGRPVTSSTPQPAQEGPSYLYRREFPIPPKGTAAHLAQVGVLGLLPLAPDDLVTTLGALPYLQLATGVTTPPWVFTLTTRVTTGFMEVATQLTTTDEALATTGDLLLIDVVTRFIPETPGTLEGLQLVVTTLEQGVTTRVATAPFE